MAETSSKKAGCLLLGALSGAVMVCLVASCLKHEMSRRADNIDIKIDRRIADEISALVESKLRLTMKQDASLAQWGDLRSWEPRSWNRGGPAWMAAGEANWRLSISGIAHFEKEDIPVQIWILKGPKEIVAITIANHKHVEAPGSRPLPVLQGSALHPDFVQGPPHRSQQFAKQ